MPKSLDSNKRTGGEEQFEVIRRTPDAPREVMVNGQVMRFGKSGGFRLSDRGKAQELFDKHSPQRGDGSLVVIPVEKREHGRRTSFLVSLPKNYKREADNG